MRVSKRGLMLVLAATGALQASAQQPGQPAQSYAQAGGPLVANATTKPAEPPAAGPPAAVALAAAQAAIAACRAIDQHVAVTVVDSAGIPKIVLASDGTSARGVQSSTNKALTALKFKTATDELEERAKTDAQLREQLASNATYNTHGGGLVLLQGQSVLGAVGVGGAQGGEKDAQCAKAAFTLLQKQ